jgi:hypothetical protein
MELGASREPSSLLVGQDIPRLLSNKNVHYSKF